MLPVYEIDCTGIKSPNELWQRYLDTVPVREPASFGYTLDSFWDGVQWGCPGWPGECEVVFRNVSALSELKTLSNKPFLEAFRQLVEDTDRVKIRLECKNDL